MISNKDNSKNDELSTAEYSEAGLASGIAARIFVQPFDVLKIRFQLQEEPIRGANPGKYTGFVQSVRLILKEEGIRAFWKGHIPAQGLSAVYGLAQFSSYEFFAKELRSIGLSSPLLLPIGNFVAGGLSGMFAMTAAMPLDVIRTRLVAQKDGAVYRGTWHAVSHISRAEGIGGYFRGWVPSVLQIMPFTGVQFALYKVLNGLYPSSFAESHESTMALINGAASGTIAKTVLYPLDLVRHRLQMRGFCRLGFGRTSSHLNMWSAMLAIVRNESWLGLFKGLVPSQIKAAVSSGFIFLFYESFCSQIRAHHDHEHSMI